jgi:hypothetical protein
MTNIINSERIIRSELKTDLEGFNNLMSRKEIESKLNKWADLMKQKYEFINVPDRNYWKNENDTIVIVINKSDFSKEKIQQSLEILKDILEADEYNPIFVDGYWIARYWWD